MDRSITIVTLLGGTWERTPNGGDVYVGGDVLPLFVDANILYDQFMQMLYSSWGINAAEFTISTKAIFVGSTQVLGLPQRTAKINTDNSFRAFINTNDSRYVSSMGYCHLYLTVEPITRADHSKAHVPKHTSIPKATTPFRSSSGSNQLSEPMPAMMTQF
ncbi:hypothetical protein OWV82_008683 [Melia azedarach]|uniref:Uncharacterized protein n=1 Tax=Melia azedarach TaxID=155640 RepID=A0ACC1YB36_MELAZ|nr:hypothetical protein OWV82_008683 [Melia azedarach]